MRPEGSDPSTTTEPESCSSVEGSTSSRQQRATEFGEEPEIWSTASSLPGSRVGILSQNQSPSIVTSNNQLVNFSGNVSVTPSLAYWVVLNAQDGSSSQVLWSYTNDAPSTSGFVGVTGTEILVTTDPPVNWAQVSGVTQGRLMMDVTAMPEPTAFALAGVGALLSASVVLVRAHARPILRRNGPPGCR